MENWYGDVINMLVKFVYFWPGWRVRGTEVRGHVLETRVHTLFEAQCLLCVCLPYYRAEALYFVHTVYLCFSTIVTNQRLQN